MLAASAETLASPWNAFLLRSWEYDFWDRGCPVINIKRFSIWVPALGLFCPRNTCSARLGLSFQVCITPAGWSSSLEIWGAHFTGQSIAWHFFTNKYADHSVGRKALCEDIKTYYYTLFRMANIWNADTTEYWQGCEATGTLMCCWWECKMAQPLWKRVWQFLTKRSILFSCIAVIVILNLSSKELKTYGTLCLVAQSCPTLCDLFFSICSSPCSSIHGIFQARILSGLPFPPPGDLPNLGIKSKSPVSPALQADYSPTQPSGEPGENVCPT